MTETDFALLTDWPEKEIFVTGVMFGDGAGRYCLQLRDDIPTIGSPGKWGVFGGHGEAGETPLQTAQRELFEETGIMLDDSAFAPLCRMVVDDIEARQFWMEVKQPIPVADMRVLEGAGFGYFAPQKIKELDTIHSLPLVLQYLENR